MSKYRRLTEEEINVLYHGDEPEAELVDTDEAKLDARLAEIMAARPPATATPAEREAFEYERNKRLADVALGADERLKGFIEPEDRDPRESRPTPPRQVGNSRNGVVVAKRRRFTMTPATK